MKNVIRKRRAYIREIEREEKMDFERTSDPDMLELFFGPEGVKSSIKIPYTNFMTMS